jgi:hypothetical protein
MSKTQNLNRDWVSAIGAQIFDGVKKELETARGEQLAPADVELLQRVSNDAAELHLEAALLPAGPMRDALMQELKIVDASVGNLQSVATETGRTLFWNVVKSVISRMVGLAFAMLA